MTDEERKVWVLFKWNGRIEISPVCVPGQVIAHDKVLYIADVKTAVHLRKRLDDA